MLVEHRGKLNKVDRSGRGKGKCQRQITAHFNAKHKEKLFENSQGARDESIAQIMFGA